MKLKLKKSMWAAVGAVALGAAGASATAAAEEFTYGTLQSPLHVVVAEGVKPFFAGVEQRTGGELTGRIFPSGQLLKARGTIAGIQSGVADAGFVVPAYHATELPHLTVLSNMTTYGEDQLAIAAALNEMILLECDECLADYTAHGTFPLVSYNTTNYVLQCSKPVDDEADLQGLRIRSTGIFSERLAILGAKPINLASSEAAQALQRGQVDCVHGPWTWLKAFGLQGSVSHITDVRTGSYRGLGAMVVNRQVWEGLPAAQRQAMIAEAPGLLAGIMFGQLRQDKELKGWAAENGIEVLEGSTALREALASTPKDEMLMEQRAQAVGVDNNDELSAQFLKIVQKWDRIIDEIGHDRDAYIEAVRREIYAQL